MRRTEKYKVENFYCSSRYLGKMGKRCERMGIVKTFYDWVEMEKTKIFFITKTRALYTYREFKFS